jgi:mRNA-degrading endonuclease toxin of MazEF toxin-antitoxin module
VDILQGDVYWVYAHDLDIEGSEQAKNRPYVIVSRLSINRLGHNVVGVPLSTVLSKAGMHRMMIPLQMMIKDPAWPATWPSGQPRNQLEKSVALTDHVRVLDIRRLTMPRMGSLSTTAIAGLELALRRIFETTQRQAPPPIVPPMSG